MQKYTQYNDKTNIKVTLIVIGIAIVLFIVVFALGEADKNDKYNELLEEYTVISGDKDKMIVYDNNTYIVYKAEFVPGGYAPDRYDIQSYFASNGLPYKYNVETKEIEMIEQEVNENDN